MDMGWKVILLFLISIVAVSQSSVVWIWVGRNDTIVEYDTIQSQSSVVWIWVGRHHRVVLPVDRFVSQSSVVWIWVGSSSPDEVLDQPAPVAILCRMDMGWNKL